MTAKRTTDIYGGQDPRDLALYTIGQAARYLHVAPATLRSWVEGRTYPRAGGQAFFKPLIQKPERSDPRLSFTNLVEAHVLRALRVEHGVRMRDLRTALDYAQQEFGIERLLVRPELRTTPGNVFLARYGELINLSRAGQFAMEKILDAFLRRVDRDVRGLPARLYPFTALDAVDGPRTIAIDPRVSFGRPIVARKGISTAILAERLNLGESVTDLAHDYDLEEAEVAEAIVYESAAA